MEREAGKLAKAQFVKNSELTLNDWVCGTKIGAKIKEKSENEGRGCEANVDNRKSVSIVFFFGRICGNEALVCS